MHIAQVAPLTEAIPPKLYGGTERVVSWLTEELIALGHEVTLFASGDSATSARLEAVWPRALRLDGAVRDPNALHVLMLERVYQRAADFDFLHFHLDYYPFSLFSRQSTPLAEAGVMPRSPKGGAAARGLDARLRLQHAFMPAGDASLKTAQVNQKSRLTVITVSTAIPLSRTFSILFYVQCPPFRSTLSL